jgi:alanyl-tRNA synthetase
VGDEGLVFTHEGAEFVVRDTVKRAGALHLHRGTMRRGTLKVGDIVEMSVDSERRTKIRANHSATHLLHAALRQVLGLHVTQKGSLVAPDRLRFDFSHPKAMSEDEIAEVERLVNKVVRANAEVSTRLMMPEDAIKAGALALFGEKYGEEVRVLAMPEAAGAEPFSVELCGGTHVRRLGDIALFKIVSESAVAGGVRRIEALTGEAARTWLNARERLAREAATALRTTPEELPQRLTALIEERKRLERELADARKALALAAPAGAAKARGAEDVKTVGAVKVIARTLQDVQPRDLRGLVDEAKKKVGSGVVVFIGVADNKASLAVGVTEDLAGRVNAVELARAGATVLGGKGGGGRADFAQAGGPETAKAEAALAAILKSLAGLAGAA